MFTSLQVNIIPKPLVLQRDYTIKYFQALALITSHMCREELSVEVVKFICRDPDSPAKVGGKAAARLLRYFRG